MANPCFVRNVWGHRDLRVRLYVNHRLPLLILGGGVGLMINMKRVNHQLSLLCKEAITSVGPGGGAVDQQSTQTGSTVTFHHFHQNFKSFKLFFLQVAIKTVDIHNNAQFSLKSCTLTCPLSFTANISQISHRKCKYCVSEVQWYWTKYYPCCIMIYP